MALPKAVVISRQTMVTVPGFQRISVGKCTDHPFDFIKIIPALLGKFQILSELI